MLLNNAGYDAWTTTCAADADVFVKLGKTKLILLSEALTTIHGSSVVARFNGIAPSVPVHILTAEFAAQEPSESGPALLKRIRELIS